MKTLRLVACLVSLFSAAGYSFGSVQTFDVDIAADSPFTGNTLRVFGTIDVDPETDIVSGSDLIFEHPDAPIFSIALPSTPSNVPPVGSFDWELSGDDLYISAGTIQDPYIWQADADDFLGAMDFTDSSENFGAPANSWSIVLFFVPPGDEPNNTPFGNDDYAVVFSADRDSDDAFLFGTISNSNIPEPTTAAIWCALLTLASICGSRGRP